ncbi:MAG: (d)CMP kinase [Clostridiales bacterium]|nr:(d)CMP kinase [Clostridiales bacterium]
MSNYITIALDGPAGAGKSTIANIIAAKLGMHHLDSGALFRAVAYTAIQNGVGTKDAEGLAQLLKHTTLSIKIIDGSQHTYVNGTDVSSLIRTQQVGQGASDVGTIGVVRNFVTEQVRAMAKAHSLIVDGRDIGSVMLPNADHKFYLTASVQERAMRRLNQLKEMGQDGDYDAIKEEIAQRDHQDANRAIAPLICPKDAIVIDSTHDTVEETANKILAILEA